MNPSYDYSTRKGILPISWEDFHGICKALAVAVSQYQPEIILPIGRAGYYPGTLLSHLLQVEIYPVRVSRRVNDLVKFTSPQWLVEPPALIRNRRALIVDEICSSGETITVVKERAEAMRVSEVRSAVLYAHTWGVQVPDYIGLVTDALILNPWDREILKDGKFEFHSEYVDALNHQGIDPNESLLIRTSTFHLSKS